MSEVVVLVGASRRRQKGELLPGHPGQPLGDQVEGLVPGRLPEGSVLPDERLAQALRAIHEVHPKLALEACLTPVGCGIGVADRPDHTVALVDLQPHLAAHGTVRAGGGYGLDGLLPLVVALDQRPGRTGVDAGATELATGLKQRGPLGRPDQAPASPGNERQGAVASYLVADPDTPSADDAEVQVHLPERVVDLERKIPIVVGEGGVHVQLEIAHRVLQLAPLVLGTREAPVLYGHVSQADVGGTAELDPMARQAAVGMLGDQQLHDAAAQLDYLRRVGVHDHAVGGGGGAGGRTPSSALDLDDAHPAGAEGFRARVVAEVRDVHPGVHRRLDDRGTWARLYFSAVDGQGYLVGHLSSPSPELLPSGRGKV